MRPPHTARPRGCRPSLLAPKPIATGSVPIKADIVVIMIGRKRMTAAFTIAISGSMPSLRCRVSAFSNAAEALLAVEGGLRPELLITDMVMPGMSGKALAERLRTIEPELKVLYMSGFTDDSIVEHGVMPAGTGFLQKPFTIRELSAQVQHVLALPK